jgi:Fe-S cluster assembly ATP-binding protein
MLREESLYVLEVKELSVTVGETPIIDDLSLALKSGESYVLFGPNGSGKSTLINAIMGLPLYEVVSGRILFMGEDITQKSVDERSKLGISMGFQHPPEIVGVKLSDLLKVCLGHELTYKFNAEEKALIEAFRLTEFLDRDINVGFSGGERKRAEILQMILLRPKLLFLDEPDSGVDVESLKLIASEIQRYIEETNSTALIITHKGDILDFVKARYACVLLKGKMHCFVEPEKVYDTIKEKGYEDCVACEFRVTEGW